MAVQPPDAPLARAEPRPEQPSEQPLRPPAAPVAPADPWALMWWSEQNARGLIEHAPDIISRFDRHLRHVYVNPAVERATGLPRTHFIGKDHVALGMPADVVAHFQNVLRRVFETGEEVVDAFAFPTPGSAGVAYYQSRVVPEFGPDGAVETVLSITRDVTEQRQAEEALRESEQLFRGLVEATFDAIAINVDGAFVEANQALADLLGYARPDDLTGLTPEDIVTPVDAVRARGHIRDQYDRPYEVEGVRRDGTQFPMEVVGKNITYRGRQARITGFRDISVRHAGEETLRRQKALVELLQEVAVAANEAKHVREVLQRALDAICGFTGWPVGHVYLVDEAGCLRPVDLWHVAEARFDAFRRATAAAPPASAADLSRRVFTSGRPVWVEDLPAAHRCGRIREAALLDFRAGFALPVRTGDEVAAVLEFFSETPAAPDPLLLDVLEHIGTQLGRVVERERAESAVRESEARYRLLTENVSDLIVRHAPDGTCLYVSPASRDLLGYAPEERVGTNAFTIVHPDDVPEVERAYVAAQEGAVVQVGYRALHRDGHYVWIETTGRGLFDPATGALLEFFTASRDISERKRVEQELIEARNRAEEMSRLKTAFLNNMSHEIRTPLTSIIGFADLLRDVVPAEHHELAELIRRGGERLMNTLNSVLDLAQLESHTRQVRPAPVRLADAVEEALHQFRPQAQARDLRLHFDCRTPALRALVDPSALDRVLTNLISNAIKFTHAGGVTVCVRREADEAVLEVHDTGVGISAAFLPHLFDEFEQESSGLARRHEGTGLGLAITRRLVELMDGTIAVASKKGRGSTFTVRFPCLTPEKESL